MLYLFVSGEEKKDNERLVIPKMPYLRVRSKLASDSSVPDFKFNG